MPAWTCPDCGRRFSRTRQVHECSPAMSVEEYFSTGPPHERPVFEAVMAGLVGMVGPIHVEPVSVGVFLKRSKSFAQLRPMTRWVAISFSLDRTLRSARVSRKVIPYGRWFHHVVNVRDPADVDDELLGWLAEAYDLSPE